MDEIFLRNIYCVMFARSELQVIYVICEND